MPFQRAPRCQRPIRRVCPTALGARDLGLQQVAPEVARRVAPVRSTSAMPTTGSEPLHAEAQTWHGAMPALGLRLSSSTCLAWARRAEPMDDLRRRGSQRSARAWVEQPHETTHHVMGRTESQSERSKLWLLRASARPRDWKVQRRCACRAGRLETTGALGALRSSSDRLESDPKSPCTAPVWRVACSVSPAFGGGLRALPFGRSYGRRTGRSSVTCWCASDQDAKRCSRAVAECRRQGTRQRPDSDTGDLDS